MADEYISRKAAMEYLYRAINADPEGNCPNCIHDEHDCQYDRCWTLMDFCEKIEYIGYVPAADVASVVRCKDCKHGTRLVCDLAGNEGIECRHGNIVHKLDWFCADGTKTDG